MALRRLPGWVVNSASIDQMVDYLLQHWSRGQQVAASNRTQLTTLVETYLRGRTRQSPRDIVRLVTVQPGAAALQVDLEASAVAAILDEAAIIQQSLGIVGGTFQIAVPKAVAWAQNYALDLAQYLTTTQEQAITSALVSALNPATALNGLQLAPLIVGSVGLTPTQTIWVMNRYRRLLAAGRSAQDAMTGAMAYADRLRLQRARTIARTEINRALISGRMEAWKDAQSRGLMTGAKKRWLTAPDCCDLCLPLNGQTVGLDELFDTPWGKVDSPRFAHPNCRCNAIIESGLVNIDVLAGLVDNPDEPWMQDLPPEDVPEMVPPDGYYPAAPLLAKGDRPGHPFRGNQWTGGIGGGPPRIDGLNAQAEPGWHPYETLSGGMDLSAGARDDTEVWEDSTDPHHDLLRLKIEHAQDVAKIVSKAEYDGLIPTNAPWMLPDLQRRLLSIPSDEHDYPTSILTDRSVAAFTKHLNADAAAADLMKSPAAREAAVAFFHEVSNAGIWHTTTDEEMQYAACYAFADISQVEWASGSGTKHSRALKYAVDRATGTATPWEGASASGDQTSAERLYLQYKPAFDAYATSVYRRTQALLKKKGISTVTVDRGMILRFSEWEDLNADAARAVLALDWTGHRDDYLMISKPSSLRVLSDPLSSWAVAPMDASVFHRDARHANQSAGVHLTARFPASSVWSLAETGPGCVDETEAIIGNSNGAIVTASAHADPDLLRQLRLRMAREGVRKGDEIPTMYIDFPGLGGADWPKRTDDTWSIGISTQTNAIGKGEATGHPFRGNQWTGGIKGGGPGSKAPPTHKRWPSEAKLRSWYGNTPEEVVASLAKMYPWAEVSGFGPDVVDPVKDKYDREPRKDFDMKVLLGITYAMDLCQQQFPEQARRIKHLSGSFQPAKPIYDLSTLSFYTPSDDTVAYQSTEYDADPVTVPGPFKDSPPRTLYQIDAQINFWGMRERNPDSSGRFDPMTLLLEPHKRRWGAAMPDGSQLTMDMESSARSAAHEFGHALHAYRLRQDHPEGSGSYGWGLLKKEDVTLRHALTYDKYHNPGFYSGTNTAELLAEEFSLGLFGTKGDGRIDPMTRKPRTGKSPYYDGIMAYLRDGDIDRANNAVWSDDTSVRGNRSFRKSDEITTEPAECRPTAHGEICIDTFGGPQAVVKGEGPGHKFRGNQWTGGIRGGGGDHLAVAPLADRIARYGSDPAQIVEHIKSMFPRLAISDAWRVTSTTREGGWPLSGGSDRTRATAGGGFAFDTVPGLTKEEAVETLTAIAQAVDDMSALFPEITYDINKIFIGSGSHGGDVGAHVDGMGMRLDPYRARDYIHNAETMGVGIPHQWAGTKGAPEQLGRAMYAVVVHELAHAAHFHAEMTSGDVAGLEDGTITADEQISGKTKSGKRRSNQRSNAMVKFHEEAFWTLSQDSVPGNKGWINWDDSPSSYARTDEGEWVAEVVTAHLLGVTPNSPNAKKIMTWLKDQQRKYRIKWSDMDWSKFMTRDPMTPSGDLAVVAKGSGDFVDDFDGSVIWRWVLGDDAINKGEAAGHPFRGNQWTGGIKGGGSATGELPTFAGVDLGAEASHHIDTQGGEGTRAHDSIQEAGTLAAYKAAADLWTHDTFPKVLADAAVMYSPIGRFITMGNNRPRTQPSDRRMEAMYLKHYAAATTAVAMAQDPATRSMALEVFEQNCVAASDRQFSHNGEGVPPKLDDLMSRSYVASGTNPLLFRDPAYRGDQRTPAERYEDARAVYRDLGISGAGHADDRALLACYFFACEMQNQWARSSGARVSYALKHSVAHLSNTELHDWQGESGAYTVGLPQFDSGNDLYIQYSGIFDAYVKAVHANTQRFLKEAGVGTSISLYRGVTATEDNAQAMAAARQIVANSGGFGEQYPKRPWVRTLERIKYTPFTKTTVLSDSLSAWATDEDETKDFAVIDVEEGAGAGIGFRMEAPIQAVWSTPVTGPGCFDEAEAIVLNTNKATALGRVIAYERDAKVFSKTDEPEIPEIYIDFPGLGGADWPKRTNDTGYENESQ